MFFTTVGRILAFIIVAMGVLRIGMGVGVILSDNPELTAARYLGSGLPGPAIDKGALAVIAGVALGILTDISRSLVRSAKNA